MDSFGTCLAFNTFVDMLTNFIFDEIIRFTGWDDTPMHESYLAITDFAYMICSNMTISDGKVIGMSYPLELSDALAECDAYKEQAKTDDYCHEYAREMVHIGKEIRKMMCDATELVREYDMKDYTDKCLSFSFPYYMRSAFVFAK